MAVTAVAGGLWAIGRKYIICVVLWPGMMLGWALVFGDNIRSFDEVTGIITSISLVTNGIVGFILGALVGCVMKLVKHQKQSIVGEHPAGR